MSFLARLRGWIRADQGDGGEDDPAAKRAPDGARRAPGTASAPGVDAPEAGPARREVPPQILRLARVGAADGPGMDEAIATLRQVRGTIHEAAAVNEAMRAAAQRGIPEPVRVACADILAARGDERGALDLLEGVTSTAGLVLAADLYAGSGQLARAVGTIERVLARDLGAPGARERHQRWSAALGYAQREVRRLDEATVVAPQGASGPFRLLREVARGGAGTVYEAEDEVLGRRVAFKVYHGRGQDRAVLEREVRTAVALGGPGILRVFDADPEQGWVTLEWVARGSVRDVLRTGDPTPLAPVARWARPLARALARVHAEGLVHADVKPANVLLRAPHDPVLGDFGIARRIGAPAAGGSPGYLSPERLAGRASDPRDDVYAYGRVLEDVIHRLEGSDLCAGEDVDPWRALALACIGPDAGRPEGGAELVRALP